MLGAIRLLPNLSRDASKTQSGEYNLQRRPSFLVLPLFCTVDELLSPNVLLRARYVLHTGGG